jgi:hypothetical protein
MSQNAKFRFYINNNLVNAPLDWENIEVLSTFDNDSTQANISSDSWVFVGNEANIIKNYVNDGITGGLGIFESMPFKIEVYNDSNNTVVFDGFIDLSENYEDSFNDDLRVKVKTQKREGLNTLNERLEALSFGYLEDLGIFGNNDYTIVNYVVQKKVNLFEELVAGFMIYQMTKELISLIKETAETIANVAAHVAGGATGGLAALAYTIAVGIVQIAYTVALTIAIIRLAKQLIETFIPPLRQHKAINLRTALTKISAQLGLTFDSDIIELDSYYYLPSNPQLDEAKLSNFLTTSRGTKKGIPNAVDYGYNCREFFELCTNLFNAKIAIKNGYLYFYTENSNFWLNTASYSMPSVRPRTKEYNTTDLKANRVIYFDYDLNDEWTVENFEGTNYEIVTDSITKFSAESTNIKGTTKTAFNVCLPTRKDELNFLEKAVIAVKDAVNNVVSALGGNANLNINQATLSALKQSNNWHSKPKIIPLNSANALSPNYKNLISAKYLYNNYHVAKSFVSNNYYGQKIVYKNVRIPFGFSDYLTLIDNSYFTDFDGKTGKVTSIKWRVGSDYAVIDYWIREPYTKNLKETFIEPS